MHSCQERKGGRRKQNYKREKKQSKHKWAVNEKVGKLNELGVGRGLKSLGRKDTSKCPRDKVGEKGRDTVKYREKMSD